MSKLNPNAKGFRPPSQPTTTQPPQHQPTIRPPQGQHPSPYGQPSVVHSHHHHHHHGSHHQQSWGTTSPSAAPPPASHRQDPSRSALEKGHPLQPHNSNNLARPPDRPQQQARSNEKGSRGQRSAEADVTKVANVPDPGNVATEPPVVFLPMEMKWRAYLQTRTREELIVMIRSAAAECPDLVTGLEARARQKSMSGENTVQWV